MLQLGVDVTIVINAFFIGSINGYTNIGSRKYYIYIHVYICVYMCIHVYVYIYIYIYTYINVANPSTLVFLVICSRNLCNMYKGSEKFRSNLPETLLSNLFSNSIYMRI